MPTIYQAPVKKLKTATETGVSSHPLRPFEAFAKKPEHVRFETQEAEETIELFLRQHPIVNVVWIMITLVLALMPVVVFPVVISQIPSWLQIPAGYYVIGSLFWYLATFGFALSNFLYWFFNIYIVTNERVVDIDFYYLLYKRFTQAELTKIQDISFTSGGLLAVVFNYGNVIVETAGEAPEIVFEKIPQPEKVVETIRALTETQNGGTS